MKIATFVIIDLETTGLPHQEYNRTKITEMCLIATTRNDIRNTAFGEVPPISKLSFMLNPEKPITPDSARITGITDDLVKNSPTFKEKFNTINSFLEDLKKPVCLVAHNGNNFDYRILLAECTDADLYLPDDLLCVDSLSIFRKLPVSKSPGVNRRMNVNRSMNNTLLSDFSDILTDDEDEWPELNISSEQLQEIDELCSSLSLKPSRKTKRKGDKSREAKKTRESFKLTDLYARYFGDASEKTAHRAEGDCLMLLQCIVAAQSSDDECDFLKYSDGVCMLLANCKPLERRV